MSKLLENNVKRQILEPKIPNGWVTYTDVFKVKGINGTQMIGAHEALNENKSLIVTIAPASIFGNDKHLQVTITKKKRFIGWLGFRNKFPAGYVPVDISAVIFKHGLQDVVRARIRRSFIHADRSVTINIDMIGPVKFLNRKIEDDLSQF